MSTDATAPIAARSSALEAIAEVADRFDPHRLPAPSHGAERAVRWPGFDAAGRRDAARTGMDESVVTGDARIDGASVVIAAFDFGYRGGTLGEVAGHAIAAAVEQAIMRRLPFVSLVASGGARVQEGMIALVQMQRIAAALAAARRAGVPHVTVLRDPVAGGVWAALGAAADVAIAVRGARISFAGERIRPADDEQHFVAEGQLRAGAVDEVVPAARVRDVLAGWVDVLAAATRTPTVATPVPPALGAGPAPGATAWSSVLAARSAERPRADAYLDAVFTQRREIRGDRAGGTDDSVTCGLGRRHDGAVAAFAAQMGRPVGPAGFRTVTRLLRFAERLGVPVLTLIDTPGAAADDAAEAGGIGAAIAETFIALSELNVPVTSVLIGEGGSGGALAMAAPGRLWTAPDAYFCVIAPEAAAEIVLRDRTRAEETSELLGLRPAELVNDGVACGVLTRAPRPEQES